MPYYIFKVKQDKTAANLLEIFAKFPEASARAKVLRTNLSLLENSFIKLIYAANPEAGEILVLQKRQPSSPVEEWEV